MDAKKHGNPLRRSYKTAAEMPVDVAAQVGAVGIQIVLAKVFHNEDALRQYLRQHPKADPSKHNVKGKPSGKPKSEDKPAKKPGLKDLSDQPGFDELKGISPEKQREVIERALEMGKPKDQRKEVPKDLSDQYEVLKGLSPREQRKVIERALKMATVKDPARLTFPYLVKRAHATTDPAKKVAFLKAALHMAGYVVGPEGLEEPRKGITLQPNTIYWIGASSTPSMVLVTKVTDDSIEYMDPYNKQKRKIQRWIGEDLITKGSSRWLSTYAKYQPEFAKSIRSMLNGGKGKIEKLSDWDRVRITVKSKDPSKDLWREAEAYGNVRGLDDTDGGMLYQIDGFRNEVEKVKKDSRFTVKSEKKVASGPLQVTSAHPSTPLAPEFQNYWFNEFRHQSYPGEVENPVSYTRHLSPTVRFHEAMRDRDFADRIRKEFKAWLPRHQRSLKPARIGEKITKPWQLQPDMFVRSPNGVIGKVLSIRASAYDLVPTMEMDVQGRRVKNEVNSADSLGLVRIKPPKYW